MMSVLVWELQRRRWFVVWWTIGICGLIALTVLAYLSFGSDAKQLDSTFKDLSSSAGTFFGGTDFFSPIGYLSSQVYFITLPILLIILVTTLASSLMNRDESDATIELTLARPISRGHLLAAKALAGLCIVAIVGVVSGVVILASVKLAGLDIASKDLVMTHLLAFGFALTFGAISFALMAVSRLTRRIATVVVIALSFGSYVVSSLGSMVEWLKWAVNLMPYHYYDTAALLGGHISRGLIVFIVGGILLSAIAATIGYTRRDIG